ncbi:MAG: hypothetical protein ACK4S0_02015 [Sediminibacterium sp.]|nr:hypothetical protein [uncultured Sediminibacterium sp.]
MKFFYLYSKICLFLFSCNSVSDKLKSEGQIIDFKIKIFSAPNETKNEPLSISQRIWFIDSFAIEEIVRFQVKDSANTVTQSSFIDRYRFNDLRNKVMIEFKSLSDTAIALNRFEFSDTLQMEGGWGFFGKRNLMYDSVWQLPDTIIHQVNYKHFRSYQLANKNLYINYLLRNDIPQTVFDIDPQLSKKFGGTLTIVYISTLKNQLVSSTEVEFIPGKLPDTIADVIKVWKRYL